MVTNNYIELIEKRNENIIIFDALCCRAKEIIFNVLENIELREKVRQLKLNKRLSTLSPIEQIFFAAFCAFSIFENECDFNFKAQKEIVVNNKKYIADFYVDRATYKDFEIDLKNPIIIELDGFDYHSNKEQMNYDYEREQDLQLAGYKIMRFTGSQIFNNPCECVIKVYKYVLDTTIKEKRD